MPRQEARLVVSSCEVAGGAGKALALSDGSGSTPGERGQSCRSLLCPPIAAKGSAGMERTDFRIVLALQTTNSDELGARRQCIAEDAGAGSPAVERLNGEQRGVVVRARQVGPDRLGGAVLQHDAGVVAVHRVPNGGFDADARGAAGHEQILG